MSLTPEQQRHGRFHKLSQKERSTLSNSLIKIDEVVVLAKLGEHPSSDIAKPPVIRPFLCLAFVHVPSGVIEVYQEEGVVLPFFDFVHVVFLGLHFLDEKIVDLTQEP